MPCQAVGHLARARVSGAETEHALPVRRGHRAFPGSAMQPHPPCSQRSSTGASSSIASASARKRSDSAAASAVYHTVRPFFSLDSSPARAIVPRWRATIEKSIEQHSATSVTEQGRPHLSRHESNFARVGSARALSSSGSSSRSSRARLRAACLGEDAPRWIADAITQVLARLPRLSRRRVVRQDGRIWPALAASRELWYSNARCLFVLDGTDIDRGVGGCHVHPASSHLIPVRR